MRYLTERSVVFSSNLLYHDQGLVDSSRWLFTLTLPSVKRQLDQIEKYVNKSLFLKQQYLSVPLFLQSGSVRFTLTAEEIKHTVIELKLYK